MELGNERAAWVSGMVVGALFGALAIQAFEIAVWLGIIVILGWSIVLLSWVRIEELDRQNYSGYDGLDEVPDSNELGVELPPLPSIVDIYQEWKRDRPNDDFDVTERW